jgi:hypothetical protein
MGTCMARRGFLTLSDCGNPATTMCGTCSRPMCPMHLSPSSGFSTCLDCAATNPREESEETEEQYDDEWAHRYRDDYYSSTSYRPFYSGTRTDDSYYSSQDVRSFDESANERDFGDDESDTGGFEAS